MHAERRRDRQPGRKMIDRLQVRDEEFRLHAERRTGRLLGIKKDDRQVGGQIAEGKHYRRDRLGLKY